MKWVLIFVERPRSDDHGMIASGDDKHNWQYLRDHALKFLQPVPKSQRLGEGMWQIPLDSGLQAFSELMVLAGKCGFPYRVLFFDKEPEWITSGKPT